MTPSKQNKSHKIKVTLETGPVCYKEPNQETVVLEIKAVR